MTQIRCLNVKQKWNFLLHDSIKKQHIASQSTAAWNTAAFVLIRFEKSFTESQNEVCISQEDKIIQIEKKFSNIRFNNEKKRS